MDGPTMKNSADGADAAIEQKNPSIEMVSALHAAKWPTTEHTKGTLLIETESGSRPPHVQ